MRCGRRAGWLTLILLWACRTDARRTDPATALPVPATPASGEAVNLGRLKQTVYEFAHDGMRGRDSRDPVATTAAARYLAREHRRAGTRPVGDDYMHSFQLVVGSHPGDEHHFWVDTRGRSHPVPASDFVSLAMGRANPRLGGAVFLGMAEDRASEALDLRRKIAMVRRAGPGQRPDDLRALVSRLAGRGAAGLVLLDDRPSAASRLQESEMPVVSLSYDAAVELFPPLAEQADGELAAGPLDQTLISLAPVQVDEYANVPNVVAYLPGRERRREIVVIGAHYDHIGTSSKGIRCVPPSRETPGEDRVCNGADDNASGTALLLELARVLASRPRPPSRSMVFAHFAGEELGLLGSRALSSTPPKTAPFADGHVVAMLNFDMVGRYREDPGLTIGAVSSSETWEPLLDGIDHRGLAVRYERAVSNRSDHASYYRQDIPVLFFFTGLHPDYHRTSDEAELVAFEALHAITEIALDVALALADGAPIAFRAPTSPGEGETSALPGVTE